MEMQSILLYGLLGLLGLLCLPFLLRGEHQSKRVVELVKLKYIILLYELAEIMRAK